MLRKLDIKKKGIINTLIEAYNDSLKIKENIKDIENSSNKQEELQAYVEQAISDLVDAAPEELNTLKELAEALNNDSNFAATVIDTLSQKVEFKDLSKVATSGNYEDLNNLPVIDDKMSIRLKVDEAPIVENVDAIEKIRLPNSYYKVLMREDGNGEAFLVFKTSSYGDIMYEDTFYFGHGDWAIYCENVEIVFNPSTKKITNFIDKIYNNIACFDLIQYFGDFMSNGNIRNCKLFVDLNEEGRGRIQASSGNDGTLYMDNVYIDGEDTYGLKIYAPYIENFTLDNVLNCEIMANTISNTSIIDSGDIYFDVNHSVSYVSLEHVATITCLDDRIDDLKHVQVSGNSYEIEIVPSASSIVSSDSYFEVNFINIYNCALIKCSTRFDAKYCRNIDVITPFKGYKCRWIYFLGTTKNDLEALETVEGSIGTIFHTGMHLYPTLIANYAIGFGYYLKTYDTDDAPRYLNCIELKPGIYSDGDTRQTVGVYDVGRLFTDSHFFLTLSPPSYLERNVDQDDVND